MLEQNYESEQIPRRIYEGVREEAPVVSLGEWVGIILILMLPIINLVMLFIWAVDKHGNPNRRNFARAYLIYIGIVTLLAVMFIGMFAGLILRFGDIVTLL